MGTKKYPPLTPDEVIKILAAKGFLYKGTEGSHRQYEKGSRKVTVDVAMRDYGIDLMQVDDSSIGNGPRGVLLRDESHRQKNQ